VKDASQMSAMVPIWQRAFDLFAQAIAAAEAVTKTPANAVIDWTSFPKPILDDAKQLAQAAHDAFTAKTAISVLVARGDGRWAVARVESDRARAAHAAGVYGRYERVRAVYIRSDEGEARRAVLARSVFVERELHVELHRRRLERDERATELVDAHVRSGAALHSGVCVSP